MLKQEEYEKSFPTSEILSYFIREWEVQGEKDKDFS